MSRQVISMYNHAVTGQHGRILSKRGIAVRKLTSCQFLIAALTVDPALHTLILITIMSVFSVHSSLRYAKQQPKRKTVLRPGGGGGGYLDRIDTSIQTHRYQTVDSKFSSVPPQIHPPPFRRSMSLRCMYAYRRFKPRLRWSWSVMLATLYRAPDKTKSKSEGS